MDKLGEANNSPKTAVLDCTEDPWFLSRPQLQEDSIRETWPKLMPPTYAEAIMARVYWKMVEVV